MTFQDRLVGKLKRRYHENIELQKIFDDLTEKICQLEEELEEFTRYGFDVDVEIKNGWAKLSIGDYCLIFQIYHDYDPPFIHITWGTEEEIHSHAQIEFKKLSNDFNVDSVLDHYLYQAFNDLLNELNKEIK